MSYKISIPEPCHENWHTMTPTDKGAFCQKCAKEVIDFTGTSPMELARKLERGDNLCGRFRPDQLDTPLPALTRNRWRERMAALGFTSLMLATTEGMAQEKPEEVIEIRVEEVESYPILGRVMREPLPMPEEGVEIKGVVLDQDHQPLPGANVSLVGTQLAAQTNFDGAFTLRVAPNLTTEVLYLEVNYIGFLGERIKVNPGTTEIPEIKVSLETFVLGGIAVSRPSLLRRIGNLFRRKW